MTGAIALAGMAALRAGAGLVRLAVPDVCLPVVAGLEPSYMTVGLPSDRGGRIRLDARQQLYTVLSNGTGIGLGPGLGRSLGLDVLVAEVFQKLPQPLVVDADGLNALATRPGLLHVHEGPRILTPHPGEFARLTGRKGLNSEERRPAAVEFAFRNGVIVVLKGYQTVVTDGTTIYVNQTGNPGMATGGTGDVLTGLIVGLVCRGLSPLEAAILGVYLHGLAGDLAAEKLTQESLTARDLIDFMPEAFKRYLTACGGF